MEVLSGSPSLSEKTRDIILKVIEQIGRIELLLKSLLNFAQPPKPQFLYVDVNDVFDTTISLAERHPLFLSNNSRVITIVRNFDSRLPKTMADPIQLQQVFMYLFLNAADAMPKGGTLTAQTLHEEESPFLRITIKDTSSGIDNSMINKIFLPFFTTKPKGTGLGLAITKRLVEQQKGSTLQVVIINSLYIFPRTFFLTKGWNSINVCPDLEHRTSCSQSKEPAWGLVPWRISKGFH
jgi:signal transduction histidine kinase